MGITVTFGILFHLLPLHSQAVNASQLGDYIKKECAVLQVKSLRKDRLDERVHFQDKLRCFSDYLANPQTNFSKTSCKPVIEDIQNKFNNRNVSIWSKVFNRFKGSSDSCESESSRKPKPTSEEDDNDFDILGDSSFDNDFFVFNGSKNLQEGDILFTQIGNEVLGFHAEHLEAVGEKTGTKIKVLEGVFNGIQQESYKLEDLDEHYSKEKAFVLRLKNRTLAAHFLKALHKKADGNPDYSISKLAKTLLARGKDPLSLEDKRKIVEALLRNSLLGFPKASRPDVSNEILYNKQKEICSTFLGNALTVSYLLTQVGNNPEFSAEVKALETALKHKNSDQANAILKDTANKLLKNDSFVKAANFDHSPIYKVNLNRALPADLIRFMIGQSSNPCRIVAR